MADRFVEAHIQRLPMFAALPQEQLRLIADATTVRRYERGEIIFQQGQVSLGLYLLVSGQAVLMQMQPTQEQRQVGVVNPNQFVNEMSLYRYMVENATLYAVQPSIVLIIEQQLFQNLMRLHPELVTALGKQTLPPAAPQHPPQQAPVQRTPPPAPQQQLLQNQYPVQPKIQTPPSPAQKLPRFQPSSHPGQQRPQVQASAQTAPLEAVEFEGQRRDEKVLVMTRRHWWALVRETWKAVLSIVLLFVVSSLVESQFISLMLVLLMVLLPGLMLVYFYFEWNNDLLIVTDQRIHRSERIIFPPDVRINDIPIQSIQSINADYPPGDPFARLFDYGDIYIKTAGDSGNVRLDFVPQPEALQDIIFKYRSTASPQADQQNRDLIRAEIERVLTPGALAAKPAQASPKPPEVKQTPGRMASRYIDEKNNTIYRKHWIIWLRAVFVPLTFMLIAIFIGALSLFMPSLQNVGLIVPLMCLFVVIVSALWMYWSDWDWRHDLYVIGDENASIIRRRPLWLQDEEDKIVISRIDSIAVRVEGMLPNLLSYGDVAISLLGDAKPKVLHAVPNPREVQEEIRRRQEKVKAAQRAAEDRRRREDIANYISVYHETMNRHNPPGVSS